MGRIIIHSDDSLLRALLHTLLSQGGVEIVEARSRHELFKWCRNRHFDRVVTDDVRMFMNGGGCTEKIRANNPDIHIFILSHDISEHSALTLLEEGVTQLLSLPISIERLQKKLLK